MSDFELTVINAFGAYAKGAAVWIKEEIEAILSSEHALHVVKVPAGTHSAAAEPVAAPAPAPVAHDAHASYEG